MSFFAVPRSRVRTAVAAHVALLALAPGAAAHNTTSSGGAAMPNRPELTEARCADGKLSCPQGQVLKIKGEYLDAAKVVVFLGRRGPSDDRRVTPFSHTPHRVVVRVPAGAPSGRLRVISRQGLVSAIGPRVRVIAPLQPVGPPSAATQGAGGVEGIFPVQGRYDYGTEVNGFGGGRNHQGQDILAKCGLPVVAGLSGRVTIAKWHDAAGNYAVVKASDGTSQVYMHLREPAVVSKGQAIRAGDRIGVVGDTGRASTCHLHFELWTAPGWYEGGEAVDPLPTLKAWAKATATR